VEFPSANYPSPSRLEASAWSLRMAMYVAQENKDNETNKQNNNNMDRFSITDPSFSRRLELQHRQKIVDVCKLLFILINNV